MKAVVFGAGRIGRGFLGHLLFEGSHDTTFVDTDAALVERLNQRRAYPLRLVSAQDAREVRIRRLRALHAGDLEAIAVAVADSDLAVTALGIANLPHVAPLLAAGLRARAQRSASDPLDILLCENQWHAASLLRDLLCRSLTPQEVEVLGSRCGLVETVVGRMVPAPPPGDDPLLLVAEPYGELPADAAAFRGAVPPLPGLVAAPDFEAYEARKLYLHNGGHAALAYLGALRGHEFIWQCVADPAVERVCRAALAEAGQALAAEYRLDPATLNAFSEDLMQRFANKALGDTVARVAADPLRKLRPDDRLVGAANLCLKHGIMPRAISRAIAAALRHVPDAAPEDVLHDVAEVPQLSLLAALIAEGAAQNRRLER